MIKKLGPVIALMLMGGTAFAEEPTRVTVRPYLDLPSDFAILQTADWNRGDQTTNRTAPQPLPETANLVDRLLGLAQAF